MAWQATIFVGICRSYIEGIVTPGMYCFAGTITTTESR